MKRNTCFFLIAGLIPLLAFGCERQKLTDQFSDAIFSKDKVFALTTTGKLKVFELSEGKLKNVEVVFSKLVALSKNREGKIVLGDSTGNIFEINDHYVKANNICRYSGTLYSIVFNSSNKMFLITSKGIFDLKTRTYHSPDSGLNSSIRYKKGWLAKPYAVFSDNSDNLWLGFGHGEWGGDLLIFNMVGDVFRSLPPEFKSVIDPIKSIVNGDSAIYISTGLMHMALYGSIIKINNFKPAVIFRNSSFDTLQNRRLNNDAHYIGPCTFNHFDHCLYFYSQHGFFKGDPRSDLSKINNWVKVFQPSLHWTNGQPDAVGAAMNVLKMEFIDKNTLMFLSQNDGIGLYNGNTLLTLQ
jgi:hypothetical protein